VQVQREGLDTKMQVAASGSARMQLQNRNSLQFGRGEPLQKEEGVGTEPMAKLPSSNDSLVVAVAEGFRRHRRLGLSLLQP